MKTRTKIVGLAAAFVLPATALAGGIAQAQSHHSPAVGRPAPAGESTGTDTDTIQQGDQTGPDGGAGQAAGPASPAAVAKPARAVGHSLRTAARGTQAAKGATQAGAGAGTSDETAGENESEGGPSDGPGGHQDPAGNVDHQFDGEE